ncbi:HAD family phosphatase [Flavihumibacter sp. RY-1]|uniref:HAD family phosphatase n=1 Tax=Flavihumibacter fluminis TaxID=2909236 RepID=A0ABS9BN32_9BACT|nr:HAD family phosphatase [Flavihumibacter fluminis]MCF1716580.1 HAD family phosphatase [Flavihumibacter fluminis]
MISAILFDLDGVILDSNPVIEAFWGKWAEREGIPFNEQIIKETIHGRTTWETIHTLFVHADDARKQEIYDDGVSFDLTMQPALIPGVQDFISGIADRGLPFILVTSSPHKRAWHFLRQQGLAQYFTDSITMEDVTKGKPDPEPYLKGAAKLGIDPDACLVFEDSDSGIRSGLDAGMRVVAVNNSNFNHERVIWTISDFTELQVEEQHLRLEGNKDSGKLAFRLP